MSSVRASILGLSACVVLACGAACSSTHVYRADAALLIPWTVEEHRARPDPPYAARYEHGGKSLVYVASRHEHHTGNATFAVVDREFERLEPEVVIIEGLTRANGLSPQFYREHVARLPEGDLWPSGEAGYSAQQAVLRGIPFVGGEPTPQQIRHGMADTPFDLRDLLCYFVVRQVPQWKRTGEDEGREFAELFAELMLHLRHAYELDESELITGYEFLAWYAEKNGRPFVYDHLDSQEAAPLVHEGALYTNRISVAEDLIRNMHIGDVIAEMLNRYDRVLIVYGAGHHVQHSQVLRAMLGPPLALVPLAE